MKVAKATGLGFLGAAVVAGALAFGIVGASADDNSDLDSLNILVATQDNTAEGVILGAGGSATSGDASAAAINLGEVTQTTTGSSDGNVTLGLFAISAGDGIDGDVEAEVEQDADADADSGDAEAYGVEDSSVSISQDNNQDVQQVSVNQSVGDADDEVEQEVEDVENDD